MVNPDLDGYVKFWEIWDTKKNKRLNRGPIHTIEDKSDGKWTITGPGRSQLLADLIVSRKYTNAGIGYTIDDLRYENLSVEPRTEALIHEPINSAVQDTVFGTSNINEKYYGLSKSTKDHVLDGSNGIKLRPGESRLITTFWRASEYWAGTGKTDSLIVDLGDNYELSRINLGFPWWGGLARIISRSYSYRLDYANDYELPLTSVQNRNFGPFHNLLTQNDNRFISLHREGNDVNLGSDIYMGLAASGTSFATVTPIYTALNEATGITARYLRVNINNTHAWRGLTLDNNPPEDVWDQECNPNYVPGSHNYHFISNSIPGIMNGKTISDTNLGPENDCYASIVALNAYKALVPVATIEPVGLQRVDNNSLQITYHHAIQASEILTTSEGFKRFEPGGIFRNISLSWTGASSTYTKFFTTDCTNCYPDGFNFGIVDQNNSLVYHSDNTSGSSSIKLGAFTKHVMTKGGTPTFISSDTWPAKADALSWGASYSYTTVTNDYAVVRFRGRSLKWYATVPSDATPATAKVEIRSKNETTGVWSSYTTLETALQLPSGISSEPVFEITYESNYLVADTTYELKITNLGGFCSIDSIEGYWSASMTEYNEDVIYSRFLDSIEQVYDGRFSNGSAYRFNGPISAAPNPSNSVGFYFTGDRIIVLGAKGHNYGKVRVILTNASTTEFDPAGSLVVPIPGGDVNGSLHVNLDTGKRGGDIAQYVIFDSNDYFVSPGLPWGYYGIEIRIAEDNGTYDTTTDALNGSYVERCHNCNSPTGEAVTGVNRFVYVDGFIAHNTIKLSADFENTTQLDIMDALSKALQMEWDVAEEGLDFKVRIGEDTDEFLREGHNTLVDWNITNDGAEIASILLSSGGDIDGLPLSTITEDKRARKKLQRTVMRKQDYRDIQDYFTLIGVSRTELKKRRLPQKRITVTHIAESLNLNYGDTFNLYTKKMGKLRVRIMEIEVAESMGGRVYTLQCERWPSVGNENNAPTSTSIAEDTDTLVWSGSTQSQAKIIAFGTIKFMQSQAYISGDVYEEMQFPGEDVEI